MYSHLVTLLQMDCLQAETIDAVPYIHGVRVPFSPKTVDRAEALVSSSSCCEDPIFTAFENVYHRPKAFGVDMEWADGPFPSDQRPFRVRLGVRRLEHPSIVGGKTRLRHLMRRYAPKVTRYVEVPFMPYQRDGIDGRALLQ
jgi:hypothetical protein